MLNRSIKTEVVEMDILPTLIAEQKEGARRARVCMVCRDNQ